MQVYKLLRIISMVTLLLVMSCTGTSKKKQETSTTTNDSLATKPPVVSTLKRCATMQVLDQKMTTHPEYRQVMEEIEKFCRTYETQKKDIDTTTFTIPVMVHVIYSTPEENISDEQVASQLEVLNKDFNKQNSDLDKIPKEFEALAATIGIRFELQETKRIASERSSWGTTDEMKFSTNGGSDAIEPTKNLNIWVCPIGSSILGYAQFPGLGETATDGIVVSPQFFGTTGSVQAPFDLGRTATHEVGHWLNLRHIWGDGGCDQDDFVTDTPLSDQPNNGCPEFPIVHCDTPDMSMNYMDYTNDACMYLFTKGQKTRIDALFASGGPRESFLKNLP